MQTFIPVALAIAQGVTQHIGEREMAKDQDKQNAELRKNALQSRDDDLAAIEARRKEERMAASQKAQDNQRQALQERSMAMAGNTQTGLSVNALLTDYLRQSLENENVIQTNLSNVNGQLDRERQSVVNLATSRVNQAPSVKHPSFLGDALKIGSNAYNTYQAVKPPEKPIPKSPPKGTSGKI